MRVCQNVARVVAMGICCCAQRQQSFVAAENTAKSPISLSDGLEGKTVDLKIPESELEPRVTDGKFFRPRYGMIPIYPGTDFIGYAKQQGVQNPTQHDVITDDGYILTLHHFPNSGAPAVLLQHGILDSSWAWVASGSYESAPGLQLWALGYDVWLSNSRGNVYGLNNTHLDPGSKAFWNFTFVDMGRYDVPAVINYILKHTGKASLSYIGHSQGASMMFALDSLVSSGAIDFDLKNKVNLFIALSPVTYLSHTTSTLIRVMAKLHAGDAVEKLYPYDFLTVQELPRIENYFCRLTAGELCKFSAGLVCGFSSLDLATKVEYYTAHFPAGTSVKAVDLYEQFVENGKFQEYDYGVQGNRDQYGQDEPPQFDMSKANSLGKIALFLGEKDDLVSMTDAVRLQRDFSRNPVKNVIFSKLYPDFSHATWFLGAEKANYYIDDMLELLPKVEEEAMLV